MQNCTHSEGKGDLQSLSSFFPPVVKSCWDGKAMLEKTQQVWESGEKVIPDTSSVCSPPLQRLPTLPRTLSTAFYFLIQSTRDPCPFCSFPTFGSCFSWARTLGAQAGYRKQLKPGRFFIHAMKFYGDGRGRGGMLSTRGIKIKPWRNCSHGLWGSTGPGVRISLINYVLIPSSHRIIF